jgi:hypothetical protein
MQSSIAINSQNVGNGKIDTDNLQITMDLNKLNVVNDGQTEVESSGHLLGKILFFISINRLCFFCNQALGWRWLPTNHQVYSMIVTPLIYSNSDLDRMKPKAIPSIPLP